MKTFLLMGIVVLVALVSLPTAVSAAFNDTVVVSGSIGGSIDVDVKPDAGVTWGTMAVGTMTDLTNATLNVTTTYPAWRVDAADAKGAFKGYMVDSVAGNLTNPFQLSNNGAPGPWIPMTGTFTNFQSLGPTGGAGIHNYAVGLRQVIAITDPAAANYQITITFTGATA
jgi:hypothetical protein